MEIKKYTDPFTGAPIETVQLNDQLIFDDPVHGGKLVCDVVDNYIKLPLKSFEFTELIPSQEACMKLHISRQRLSQLVQAEILHPIYLGNSQYFVAQRVLEYKQNRKPGRPRKES